MEGDCVEISDMKCNRTCDGTRFPVNRVNYILLEVGYIVDTLNNGYIGYWFIVMEHNSLSIGLTIFSCMWDTLDIKYIGYWIYWICWILIDSGGTQFPAHIIEYILLEVGYIGGKNTNILNGGLQWVPKMRIPGNVRASRNPLFRARRWFWQNAKRLWLEGHYSFQRPPLADPGHQFTSGFFWQDVSITLWCSFCYENWCRPRISFWCSSNFQVEQIGGSVLRYSGEQGDEIYWGN